MKFSIGSLLLFFLVWALVYASTWGMARKYNNFIYEVEKRRVNEVAAFANKIPKEPNVVQKRVLETTFAGYMASEDLYGNKRVYFEWETPDGTEYRVYSCGQDGVSQTNGNDRDDINSWNNSSEKFYRLAAQDKIRSRRLLRTLWLAPLVYIWIIAMIWAIRRQIDNEK